MYVCIYIYLYIHIYLNKGADSTGTGDHPRRNRLQWFRMETARCASPHLVWCRDCISRPFGCPPLTCASSCDTSNAWPLGPAAFFREVREKKDHDLWSHMVPEVMRNGPEYTSTKESWSHEWWEMVPTSIWMSIPIHWSTRSIDHGWYWLSIRIHLPENTVDINSW